METLLYLTPAKSPTRCGRNAPWAAPLTSLKTERAEFETHIALLPTAPHICMLATGHPGNFSTARSSQRFNKLFYLTQVERVQDHHRGER